MTSLPHPGPHPAAGARGGATVGGYTLLAKIGEGGMGVVHLARRDDGPRVALKVLRPHVVGDDEARARLAREVGSLRRIRSRWVAEIVDADPWAPVPYVATRYVPGLSLHDHVLEEGPVAGRDLWWFAGCLAEGLATVHAAGVLHRDVKPSNVLMEGRTPILIDFGLARVADDPKLTHTGWLLGTPGYLAPEILYGDDATAASDVHSWAATVAYAGSGRSPFGGGPSMAILDRVRRGQHDLSGLPDELARVLAAALDPDPDRRPGLDQLLDWLRPRSTEAVRRATPTPVEDLYTLPLALASATAAADEPTDRWTGARPVEPFDGAHREPFGPAPTRVESQHDTQAIPLAWDEEPGQGATRGDRARRVVLLGAVAVTTGAAAAAYPWPTLTLLLTAVWLLRSGSLAATAAGDRRRLRGRRWYDGVQVLLGAPWHLVRSLPSTLLLVLWGAGLAVAAALVCYAVAASAAVTLGVSGVVLSGALWCGPGSTRFRGPLGRVVDPLARVPQRWGVALVAVALLGAVLAWRADVEGPSWLPADDRPLADAVRTVR